MAGTPNPSANVGFGDGNSGALPDLATDVFLFAGPASAGPFLSPRRISDLDGLLNYLKHGPSAGQVGHHVVNSAACWAMRAHASNAGAIGSVGYKRSSNSVATLAADLASYTLHSQVPNNGSALNVNSGWVNPPAPLPLKIKAGAASTAIVATVTFIDEAGVQRSETVNVAGTGGSGTTTRNVSRVISVTTDVDPQDTLDFTITFTSPQDRYDVLFKVTRGGILSGGSKQPRGKWSMDNGVTFSREFDLPTTGLLRLETYAAGLIEQATGIALTFTTHFAASVLLGSIRVAGADANGDLVFTALKSAARIRVVVAGNNTPLSIAVSTDDVTINAATSAGGAVTTTAATLYAFWNSSDANAVIARTRFSLRTVVGTGASLLAAAAYADITNSKVNLTPRVEGVTVNVVESGVSTSRSVSVSGNVVAITLDTDVNGVHTTTATQLAALINGDATASKYLSATASGTGAGLAGVVSGLTFVYDFNTDDVFTFSTTPPSMSEADVSEALAAIRARDDVLTAVSTVVLVKDGLSATDLANAASWVDDVGANKKAYLTVIGSTAFQATHSDDSVTEANLQDTWASSIESAYLTRYTGQVSLVAGECDTILPSYGGQPRRNGIILYCARDAICPISVFPSETVCVTTRGTKKALSGVGQHLIPNSDPLKPQYTSLWQTEDTLLRLHQMNIITLRTIPRKSGVYIRQALAFTDDGDDWTMRPHVRVADVAATLAYLTAVDMINQPRFADAATGFLTEDEHLSIEGTIRAVLTAALLSGGDGIQHISGSPSVVSDRNINFKQTRTVKLSIDLQMKDPTVTINITINSVRTLPAAA